MDLLRTSAFIALVFACGALRLLPACESLSDTTPIPSADISDLDAGHPTPPPDAATGPTGTNPGGDPPPSARVRLANLIQGNTNIDLCVRLDASGSGWEGGKISSVKSGGVAFGEVSTHAFISATKDSKYLFRAVPVGASCESDPAPFGSIASRTVAAGSGVTIVAYGKSGGGDGAPKSSAFDDVVNPSPTTALVRAFHGATGLPPFDLVVNGETVVQSIRSGSAIGFPYSSNTGFANLAAGIAAGSTITLRAGTTAVSFKTTERVRRGLAVTIFVGGTPAALDVSLCSDRTPESGDLADCTDLQPQ